MSADNYLYVRKVIDGWKVTMECASSDTHSPPSGRLYKTWKGAYKAAQRWESEEPYGCEYGIHSDPAE